MFFCVDIDDQNKTQFGVVSVMMTTAGRVSAKTNPVQNVTNIPVYEDFQLWTKR